MTTINRGTRNRLLSGVGTAVIATMLSTVAQAAPASTVVTSLVNPGATVEVSAHKSGSLVQTNGSPIEASVINVIGGISGITDPGVQTGDSNEVATNSVQATATANNGSQSIDLALIDATVGVDPAADGVAALSLQTNAGASVTSLADDNRLSIALVGFQDGTAAATDNSIGATTQVNRANQSIAGTTPNGYVSDASGLSSLDYPAGTPGFEAEGTVVVSTLQQVAGTSATATTTDSGIGLSLMASGANSVSAAPVLDDNSISSSTGLNEASNEIDLQAGEAPAFEGSAVLSNVQSNSGGSSGSALTVGNAISAVIYGEDPGDINSLTGSLSVSGNEISAEVSGNDATGATGVAGNRVLIGDGLSFVGAGTVDAGSQIAYDGGALTQTVAADLVISSSQSNTDVTSLSALALGNAIRADVQSIGGGTVTLANNSVSASVKGNAVSSAVAGGEGAQGFAGSVAVANQQTNLNTTMGAQVAGAAIIALTGNDDGETQNSSVGVSGNTASASGYGNQASQSIALDATDLDIGAGDVALTGGTGPDGNVSAAGGATIANLQSGYNSSLTVSQGTTQIGLDADSRGAAPGGDTIGGSTLSVTGNTAESVAVANQATSGLSLASNDVGSGAGIASAQILDADSSVSASLAGVGVGLIAGTHVEDSTLTASGNLARAIAYGGSVSNSLTVESNGLTLAPTASTAISVSYDADSDLSFSNESGLTPEVAAAFGIMNDQSTQADVTASADGVQLGVSVEGNVTNSTVANEGNAYVAAAYGNDGANAMMLDIGNVDAGGFAAIGAISNTQAAGDATSAISATATGGDVILTAIEDDVTASGISTSDNLVQALAYGNRTTGNSLTVEGNNITSVKSGGSSINVNASAPVDGDVSIANGMAFAVQNAQAAHGEITASQLNGAPASATGSAAVLTTIGTTAADTGLVAGASVMSEGNRLLASATGNSAVSGVSLEGNQIAASTGVQNFQTSDADLSAYIGLAGSPGIDPINYPGNSGSGTIAGGTSSMGSGSVLTLNSGATLTLDYSTVTGTARTALEALLTAAGFTSVGSGSATASGGVTGQNFDLSFFTGFNYTGSGIGFTGFNVAGSAAIPNSGGVTIAVNGPVTGSQLSVDGNTAAGSVIANSATNSVKVAATSIDRANGLGASYIDFSGAGGGYVTTDNALSNVQKAYDSNLTSDVYAAFALDMVEGESITDSTLSVSGNSQSATAVANTAANSMELAANAISAGSGLSSLQEGGAVGISASSSMELFAPAAIDGSSLSLSDNSNTSLAVFNDVTNVSTVSAANIAPMATVGNAVLSSTGIEATGDQLLANGQSVGASSVSSTANTTLYNEDRLDADGLGLSDSSILIDGNSTMAEASANRASNSLVLNGAASQAANAGLTNQQFSAATVTSEATTTATVDLMGDGIVPAVSNSSVAISGNSTTALARGNAASNVLNVEAGSNYGAPTALAAGSDLAVATGGTVEAQAAVLNVQGNMGPVAAYASEATYGVALNDLTGAYDSAAGNSSFAVTGNSIAALAYGNSATNTLTLTALNTGTPTAAIASYQTNSGPVTARASSVSFGFTSVEGSVVGSTLSTTGNQVTATATGNSAVSIISAQ
ncbi:MAG: S-layer family protein [Sphingomonadales bacterium]|nr:MAG: S-layer family protein [Sphingomonadales bacterium]TNF03165.1 MAG: S-layer family protein [Sphingomonadales bacterium]